MNTLASHSSTLMAADIFSTIDGLAGSAKDTVIVVLGAAFFIGALVFWAKGSFSVAKGIVALFMVAIGLAILAQLGSVQGMFEDTIDNASVHVSDVEAVDAQVA
ncbi:MAG: hypothetical protein E7A06_12315 [Clostridiales bacterium]|nr:hypothetical protein [Clostridiales bacterium]